MIPSTRSDLIRDSIRRIEVASLLALIGLVLFSSNASPLALERPPYLQMGTASGIVVRWRTDTPTDTRLRYGASPGVLDTLVSIPGNRTEHEVALGGLSPDTRYYYDVGHEGGVLAGGDPHHFFRTSPLTGERKAFRMWVVGDSGAANENAVRVRNAFSDFAGGSTPEILVMLGDNAYPDGTDQDHTTGLFQTFPNTLRSAQLWCVPGNHEFNTSDADTETGPYYDAFTLPTAGEAGGVPSGTETYYSFDYGNVHFVALDSTDSSRLTSGPMYQWLMADLLANTSEWVIALWHHPPYSRGSHDSDTTFQQIQMRENFLPLLEDFGLDLMLSGHSHSYERSMMIDRHYGDTSTFSAANIIDGGDGDPNGTGPYLKPSGVVPHKGGVFAVVGSSSIISAGTFDHPAMIRNYFGYGSVVVDVASNRLTMRFLDDGGMILDEVVVVKGTTCSDGIDNDGDGLTDLLDPGCTDASDLTETDAAWVCDDAADNDGDGLIDYPNDPGCDDPTDASEQSVSMVCDNGEDDDGDTLWDASDPGCDDPFDATESNAEVECDDGLDNDDDGFVDLSDSHCLGPLGKDESGHFAQTMRIQIENGSDDAEERISNNGSIEIASDDLDLGERGPSVYAVGLRFADVAIPKGAEIESAILQFTSAEPGSSAATFSIVAEASDDATLFSKTDFDVSSRMQTTASTSWVVDPWLGVGLAGPDQQTPDLSELVQEVIDRSGWVKDNAMAFILTGTGTRTAESTEGAPGAGVRLVVTFIPEPLASVPVTYAYAGNDFTTASLPYTTSMSINVSFTLSGALGANLTNFNALPDVIAFTISDGVQTVTEADGPYFASELRVSTNAAGEIIDWALTDLATPTDGSFLCGSQASVVSSNGCATYPDQDGAGYTGSEFLAEVVASPGSWSTVPASDPEPREVPMAPFALAAILFSRLVMLVRRSEIRSLDG